MTSTPLSLEWYRQADVNTCLILIQCHILKIFVQNFYFIEFYLLALSDMAGMPEHIAVGQKHPLSP